MSSQSVIRAFLEKPRRVVLAASPLERAWLAAMALVMLVGLFLRARGQLWSVEPLWQDEAAGVHDLLTLPLREIALRPLGFLAASRRLSHWFGPSEPVLRLLPWLAGVGTVCLSPALAERLFAARGARLLFVAIVSLHPAAIDLTKEFKPYSLSLFWHASIALFALRYADERRSEDLAWTLALSFLGPFFAQDVVFSYPGTALLLYRETRGTVGDRRTLLAGGALTGAALLGQYLWLWRSISTPSESEFWGDKYGVFHRSDTSYLGWWLSRQVDLFAFAGHRRVGWRVEWLGPKLLSTFGDVDRVIFCGLALAGLVTLVAGRRSRQVLVLALPLVTLWLANALGRWPFGVFRTNLFVLLPSAGLVASAFDWPRWQRERSALLPALLLVIAPLVAFERRYNDHKRVMCHSSGGPEILQTLVRMQRLAPEQRAPLLIDLSGCRVYEYYEKVHPKTKDSLGPALRATFAPRCFRTSTLLADVLRAAADTPGPLYVLEGSKNTKATIRLISHFYHIEDTKRLGGQTALAFAQRRLLARPPR